MFTIILLLLFFAALTWLFVYSSKRATGYDNPVYNPNALDPYAVEYDKNGHTHARKANGQFAKKAGSKPRVRTYDSKSDKAKAQPRGSNGKFIKK